MAKNNGKKKASSDDNFAEVVKNFVELINEINKRNLNKNFNFNH